MSKDKYLSILLTEARLRLLWLPSFKYFLATCSNEFEYLNIYRQKRLERMLFSDTALSTSRFISSSVTKANRSPILTLILIVNKKRLEVFKIGELITWGISSDTPQF